MLIKKMLYAKSTNLFYWKISYFIKLSLKYVFIKQLRTFGDIEEEFYTIR